MFNLMNNSKLNVSNQGGESGQKELKKTISVLEIFCLSIATVYVRLFIVSFRTIKEKKVCFLLFIHNVQVSINNNE